MSERGLRTYRSWPFYPPSLSYPIYIPMLTTTTYPYFPYIPIHSHTSTHTTRTASPEPARPRSPRHPNYPILFNPIQSYSICSSSSKTSTPTADNEPETHSNQPWSQPPPVCHASHGVVPPGHPNSIGKSIIPRLSQILSCHAPFLSSATQYGHSASQSRPALLSPDRS